ncbi:uncharacterized protein CDAR_199721 [Caerostris darwini]|uniref:G-protein coupled receptors family 1 profile domain-containing protein n=1 Tax=Caerostris darwini TaxID=1538125 RepID=A0AAV4V5I4_9ARAC|nr:uncharacterized protein CDAR_199721 [Caerostris darwini]
MEMEMMYSFEFMNLTDYENYTGDMGDINDYLAAVLGPKRLPLNWLIPLTCVYAVIFTTGLIGNSCTCIVIATNPYMQTATNCYLFNLAIADMLTLICVNRKEYNFIESGQEPDLVNELVN